MISNAEIDHVRKVKHWCAGSKAALAEARKGTFGVMLAKLETMAGAEGKTDDLHENIEYLVELLEREYKTQRVRALSGDQ